MMAVIAADGAQGLGQVQSLVRAFGILDILAGHGGGMTLTELAQAAALPRSTVHRLLTTMDALRYVEFEKTQARWMVGLRAFALGNAFVKGSDIGRLVRPALRSLMLDTGDVVSLAARDDQMVRYVERARPAGHRARPGVADARLPVHASAAGKVLLAYATERELDRFLDRASFVRHTRTTIVEKGAFVGQLEATRTRGYAIDDEENHLGTRCVAVPLFDANRQLCGSLSISGHVGRLPDERIASLGRLLGVSSAAMTRDLGAVLAQCAAPVLQ